MKVDYAEVLSFLFEMGEVFSRRDCGLILAGFRPLPSERARYQFARRLERQKWIEPVGPEPDGRYRITAATVRRLPVLRPEESWGRAWDGKWRIVSYDLPESRRRERQLLWRALRARKLGLLQRSVWIWPHPVEPVLESVLESTGVPECFVGFEAKRLFLCTVAEVVTTAWDWKEIARRQRVYLEQTDLRDGSLRQCQDVAALVRQARVESSAFQSAFSLDPLLPRALWPEDYLGPEVERRHEAWRTVARRRWSELSREGC